MSLETATYINQLDAANPLGSDPIASGDDHIRLIKSTIKATFPNITGPVTATQAQLNAPFPTGGIIIWSGAANAIPAGWALCDGTNGTPNLRDRFVIGAGSTYSVGAVGGATSVTLSESQLPSHTHSASSTFTGTPLGSHNHTVSDPGHVHTQVVTASNPNGRYDGVAGTPLFNSNNNTNIAYTGITLASASAGTPSGTVATTVSTTGSGASVDIRNPYFALCYIMKV